jgi:hypothetical protein
MYLFWCEATAVIETILIADKKPLPMQPQSEGVIFSRCRHRRVVVLTRHTVFLNVANFRSYLAVDVFFILSGFVIASVEEEKLRAYPCMTSGFARDLAEPK